MNNLKRTCSFINHESLDLRKCYEKEINVREDYKKLKLYASAALTTVDTGKKKMDILSIALYEPEVRYQYNRSETKIKVGRLPTKTLYFADKEFLYKDLDGAMKIIDITPNYWGSIEWLYGDELVREFFKIEHEGLDLVRYLAAESQKRRTARLMKSHKKETDEIDKYMNLVAAVPKDIDKFIDNVVSQKSRYIYYKRGKEEEAYCTSCKNDVKLNYKKAYHNAPGRCPNCGKKITYKAKGKSTLVVDAHPFIIMQKTDEGLVMRYFNLNMRFKEHYRKPEVTYYEIARDFIDAGRRFEMGLFKQIETRWCKAGPGYEWGGSAYLYTRNLKKVLQDTEYKYSALPEFARAYNEEFDVKRYLKEYTNFKGLEYVVKLKLTNLARDLSQGLHGGADKYGKNPLQIMKLPKDKINQAIRLNVDADIHRCMVALNKAGMSLSDKDLKWCRDNMLGEEMVKMLEFTTFHKLRRYLIEQLPIFKQEKKAQDGTVEQYGRSVEKTYNTRELFKYYKDYIEMSEKIKKDMNSTQVLFPKALVTAHDDAVKVLKIIKTEEEAINLAKQLKKDAVGFKQSKKAFDSYQYDGKNYIIRLPESVYEIIEEGNKQNSCVGQGSYITRMAEGKTIIL